MSIASILSVFVSVRHDIYYNEQYSSRTHGIVVYAAVHKQWTVSEIWVLVALPRVPIHHGLGWMPGAGVFFGSRSLAFCTSDCTSGYSCADPFASPWKLRHQLFCHFFSLFSWLDIFFFLLSSISGGFCSFVQTRDPFSFLGARVRMNSRSLKNVNLATIFGGNRFVRYIYPSDVLSRTRSHNPVRIFVGWRFAELLPYFYPSALQYH